MSPGSGELSSTRSTQSKTKLQFVQEAMRVILKFYGKSRISYNSHIHNLGFSLLLRIAYKELTPTGAGLYKGEILLDGPTGVSQSPTGKRSGWVTGKTKQKQKVIGNHSWCLSVFQSPRFSSFLPPPTFLHLAPLSLPLYPHLPINYIVVCPLVSNTDPLHQTSNKNQ